MENVLVNGLILTLSSRRFSKMSLKDEFELPKDEVAVFDKVRDFYYGKDIYGLLLYVRSLLEAAEFKYKDRVDI